MNYGLDYLGGAKFKSLAIAEHPRDWAAGVFSYVDGFGDALPLVEELAKLGTPIIRVHLMWRDDHNFTSKDLPFVLKEAKRLKPIIEKYPNVKWYVSPVCEHRLNEKQWLEFANAVTKIVNANLVNTPEVGKGFVSKNFLNEYHGADSRPRGGRCAFSFDGKNCVDADVEAYKKNYKDAEYFMFWNCQINGRLKLEDKTPRPQRKAYPISRQIDSWIQLSKDKGATKLPKGWLFKSHSDQHTTPPSGKDQKPVWISPTKAAEIILKTRNGQIVDKAKYYGTFQGGGFRYYCSDWGYLIADKAKRIQGDSLCDVFVNNKKIGVVNPAFREGIYR